jgi:phytoene dehydrogenase-like protein
MPHSQINIIGAGVSGLCAGCYLQMNGYRTEIFELHDKPGGLCCSWQRRGYTIDGCIHWLVGSSANDRFYKLWSELIDMKSLRFVDFEEYMRVEDASGNELRIFTDVDRLEKELLEKAPEDRRLILDFTRAIRKLSAFRMPIDKAQELMTPADGIRAMLAVIPHIATLNRWIKLSAREMSEKCKNPLLKKAVLHLFLPDMSALFLAFTLAWMNKKSAGYPVGGSLKFARLLEKKYLELGGKIRYKSKVVKILTEGEAPDARATGIRLENGESIAADIVISASDGHATVFEMLDGKFTDQKIESYYRELDPFPSYVQVSLGVNGHFENLPHTLYFPADPPVVIDETSRFDSIGIRIHHFDPTLAPKGKTLMTALFTTRNHGYWVNLRGTDPKAYQKEKSRIADSVIDALDKRFGNIRKNVDMTDVSTPATVIRYTNNWKGSFEGWLMTQKTGFRQMKKTLPGLSDFYLIGQWVEPGGGLPSGLLSGRNAAQVICKADGKPFLS